MPKSIYNDTFILEKKDHFLFNRTSSLVRKMLKYHELVYE